MATIDIGDVPTGAPEGFSYISTFLTQTEEATLVANLQALDWNGRGAFYRRGQLVKRREIDFLRAYGRNTRAIGDAVPLPDFLGTLCAKVAAAVSVPPESLQQAIAALYRPGAHIAWHVDSVKAFGELICGVSFLNPCVFQLCRVGGGEPWSFEPDSGSLYVLRSPARYEFQHRIPPVKAMRYSVTFRQLH